MRFLNPAGLWLLLGIPVLIIIYLIKSQHEQRAVSSTYIWKLSERFAKKRLPIRRLRRILLFILQLTMIVLAALMAAKPAIVKGESYDYVVILDGSASMQTTNEKGKSRFELAEKAIEKKAKGLSNGHTMTLIFAGDTASFLCEGSESAAEVKVALQKAECTDGRANIPEALELAETACRRSKNAKVLFYTDCAYEKAGNITVVNLNKNEWNVSLGALSAEETEEGTVFTGSLVSYNKEASVTVGLAVDGKTVDAKIVRCEKDVAAEVVFERKELKDFDTAEIFVQTTDGLLTDNRFALCRKGGGKPQVLLVSNAPFYLKSAIDALGDCQVTVTSTLEEAPLSGMDLYIFDGIVPESYPTDGSVVVFGTEGLPEGLLCSLRYEDHERLSCNDESEEAFLEGLTLQDAVVKDYGGLLGNRDWTYLLYCDKVPVMASSKRANGARIAVFSFDLHDSNLPLLTDYPILMSNLFEYCLPSMIDKTDYTIGETVTVSILPGAQDVYLQQPDGTAKAIFITEEQSLLYPDDVGLYTVVMKGEEKGSYTDFFVHIPMEEMAPQAGEEINVAIMTQPEQTKQQALSGIWIWLALAFLVILLIEWEWYYYEQY